MATNPVLRSDCCPCYQPGDSGNDPDIDIDNIPVQAHTRLKQKKNTSWTAPGRVYMNSAEFCTVRGKTYPPECFIFTVYTSFATGTIGDKLIFKNQSWNDEYNSGCVITGGPDVGTAQADHFEIDVATTSLRTRVEFYCSSGNDATSTCEFSATASRRLRNYCGDEPA